MTWNDIWSGVVDFFTTSGWTILKVIGLWIIGYIVIKIMLLVLRKIFSKTKMEKVSQGFLLSVIKFVLYTVLLIMILGELGVEITGIVTALAAAGLAIGLALQSSLSNVASGIILLVTQPFKEGDYVSLNGTEGKIHNIKILTTALLTSDNKLVVMPNSSVANNAIINYSNRKTRRVDFSFEVDEQSDPDMVNKIVLDVMKSNGKIFLKPESFCGLKTFSQGSLTFFAFCWCGVDDYTDVYYYVVDNVFNEFKRNSITVPVEQLEVRMKDIDAPLNFRKAALPERVAIKSEEKKVDDDFLSFFKKFDIKEKLNKSKQKKSLKKATSKETSGANQEKEAEKPKADKDEVTIAEKAVTAKTDKSETKKTDEAETIKTESGKK